jgi:hypothetical protein
MSFESVKKSLFDIKHKLEARPDDPNAREVYKLSEIVERALNWQHQMEMRLRELEGGGPLAVRVSVSTWLCEGGPIEALCVELDDGRKIVVPLDWYPKLADATYDQRINYRLVGGGVGIHWPDIDEDLSVQGLLASKPHRVAEKKQKKQRSVSAWRRLRRK